MRGGFNVPTLVRGSVLLGLVVFGFSLGYLSSAVRKDTRFAAQAVGDMSIKVGALSHLEQRKIPYARDLLMLSIEDDLLRYLEYRTPLIDSSTERLKNIALRQYAGIRSKGAPIAYPDGGATQKQIDALLQESRRQ